MNSQIRKNIELEIGCYYHCYCKRTLRHEIHLCSRLSNSEPKKIGNVWADDENDQALDRWFLVKVEVPKLNNINFCTKHNGIGFVSDCKTCNGLVRSLKNI